MFGCAGRSGYRTPPRQAKHLLRENSYGPCWHGSITVVSAFLIHGRVKIMVRILAVGCLFFASTSAGVAVAQSLGHYHLPSTVLQYSGHGFGAGYHAPMIRPGHCHPPRQQRYVRVPGYGPWGALPMENFPTGRSVGCHAQLDQLLEESKYGVSPVTPTEARPSGEAPELLPESPQVPMLPMP